MSSSSWLWESLHDLFDTDDGSLPDVYIENLNSEAIVQGYALLRERASHIVTHDPSFWSIHDGKDCPLESVPNAAALVVSFQADPFHVVFGGITAGGCVVPDLGVFVFQESLALDYRMGPEWGPPQLEAFFHLLMELTFLNPNCTVQLDEHVTGEVRERFQKSRMRFLAEHAT
jgi:hypothetical protein